MQTDSSASLQASSHEQPSSPSKRSLLKVAWIAPMVVAINLPRASYAANISGTDKRHNDPHRGDDHRGSDNRHSGKDR
jgi:hypothetical protein